MNRYQTRESMRAALFCAVTAVASQIILPIQPVPFSFSVVAVYLCGALLAPRTAFFAQMAYLLLGAAGAPIFSGFSGGLGKLAGPTGGYLIAYPFMALIVSWITHKWGNGVVKNCAAMGAALICCYVMGMGQLMLVTGVDLFGAFMSGVAMFIPIDLAKIAVAAIAAVSLRKALSTFQRQI